jgi:hypothetical protein
MRSASRARSELRIVLWAPLSPRGKRDALRQGIEPSDDLRYEVEPGHALWPRIVDLDPALDQWEIALPLNRRWDINITGEPRFERLASDGSGIALWDYPTAELAWGRSQPLDEHPGLERLLDMEETHRAQAARALQAAENDLDESRRVEWRVWFAEFISDCWSRQAKFEEFVRSLTRPPASIPELDFFRACVEEAHPSAHDAGVQAAQLFQALLNLNGRLSTLKMNREAIKRKKALVEEATAWAVEHGSSRLQKAVAAGLVDSSLGVYRDERLAFDHPGWHWIEDEKLSRLKAINNPSECALDALLDARAWDPEARMHWLDRGPVVVATFIDRWIYLDPSHPRPPY